MKKQVLRLTESELNRIIEESVYSIINEEMMNEGWWDTAKSFMGQYGKRGAQKTQELGNAVGSKMKQGYNAVKQGYNNVKTNVQQTAQNARRDSSMKDMSRAFEAFKAAVEKYRANGGQINNQLNSRIAGIDKMINGYQRSY
jgi:uncharacterized protein YukE